MQENKNLVQEALIQMKNVEEAIAQNAKGILASTMKEEINQLVKESLSEQDMEDEVELDVDMDDDTEDVDMDTDNEDEMDMELDMDMDMDSEESPIDLTDASDEEILRVFKAMGEEDGIIVKKDGEDIHLSDEDADVEYLVKLGESEEQEEELDEIMDLEEMDFEEMDPEEMDSNSKTTDQVIDAIFNVREDVDDDFESEEDEDEVMFEIEMEEEYMDEDDMGYDMEEEFMYEIEMEEDMDDDEIGDEELDESYDHRRSVREAKSTVKPKGVGIGKGPKFAYKKTEGGFDEDKKVAPKTMGTGKAKFEYKKGANMEGKSKVVGKKVEAKEGDYSTEKEEATEAARTYGMGSKKGRGLRKGITPNRNFVYGKNGVQKESLETEVATLREKNEEYRKALNVFREKLNEVAIFNSNLAYATRLFTEHSTTKKEKINILRRFDNVETLKESKNLYKSIKDELSTSESTPINESVETKLNKNVSSGSSTTLIESKTYENPQFLRMKDLMSKIG